MKRDSEADRRIVDRFWNWKDEVYRYLIRSERGVFADHICQYVAGRSLRKLSRADYFASERDLFRKLPEIRRLLLSRAARQSEALPERQDLPYKQRRFIVDPDGDFFAREDRKRYRQEKTDGVLSLPQLSGRMLAAIEAEMAGGAGIRDDETLF